MGLNSLKGDYVFILFWTKIVYYLASYLPELYKNIFVKKSESQAKTFLKMVNIGLVSQKNIFFK